MSTTSTAVADDVPWSGAPSRTPDQPPTTSVVICTHDRSHLVRRAIDACLRQTFVDFEVVVVDDGSTDDTAVVLRTIEDPRVRTLHTPNGGLSRARNHGIEAARGRYLVFLDDDDTPDEDWLAVLVGLVDADHPVACCALRHVRPDGVVSGISRPRRLGPAFYGATALFRAGSFIIDASLLDAAGRFEPRAQCSHHTELSFRVLELLDDPARRIAVVQRPLVSIETRPASARARNGDPTTKLDTVTFMLDRHRHHFARQPKLAATYWSIAGVAAARLGDHRTARRHFRRSLRLRPKLRTIARLALAGLGRLGAPVWRSRRVPEVAR